MPHGSIHNLHDLRLRRAGARALPEPEVPDEGRPVEPNMLPPLVKSMRADVITPPRELRISMLEDEARFLEQALLRASYALDHVIDSSGGDPLPEFFGRLKLAKAHVMIVEKLRDQIVEALDQ